MKDKLTNILNELSEVIKATGIDVTQDIIFSKAIDIFIAESIEVNKDRRTAQINSSENPDRKVASYKQTKFLENLGYKGDTSKLTSLEASQLIKELKDKPKQEKEPDIPKSEGEW